MNIGPEEAIKDITFDKIEDSLKSISSLLKETPIVSLDAFNKIFDHDLYFKLENLQETRSFKARGVITILSNLKKHNKLPKKIVTYGTGNHGIALAWASKHFGIKKVKIYLPHFTSEIKKELAKKHGAQVVITETRAEAEARAQADADNFNYKLIPPSDNDEIIAGAATVSYEALQKQKDIDAIFVPIGGGSLSSGTILVRNHLSPTTKVYAGEPKEMNDASLSYRTKKIFRFKKEPKTIADGATALGVTQRVFNYIKQLDGIFEISEKEIAYWTAQFYNLNKISCEPTSALAIAAAYRWIKEQNFETRKKILIIISGGNISASTKQEIYNDDSLKISPTELKFDNPCNI